MKKINLKKKTLGALSILALFVAVVVPVVANPKPTTAWECKSRNVINCGVNDRAELANTIRNDAGINQIFDGIGIYADDIMSPDAQSGVVKNDGSVWVGNTQVATTTVMGQRGTEGIEGVNTPWAGINWAYTYRMFDPSIAQQGAFVYMRNGQFMYAVVLSCGNPVLKSLRPVTPGIAINKDVRNITTDPNGNFADSTTAKPGDVVEFRIEVLDNSQVTTENVTVSDVLPGHMTLVPNSGSAKVMVYTDGAWQLQTQAIPDAQVATGRNLGNLRPSKNAFVNLKATIGSDVPEGCTNLVNAGSVKSHQTQPITSTANVTVCKTTPPTPPVTPPVTPSQPTSLPVSGPVEAAAGVVGTGALGYAGYLWRRSRQSLMANLKK